MERACCCSEAMRDQHILQSNEQESISPQDDDAQDHTVSVHNNNISDSNRNINNSNNHTHSSQIHTSSHSQSIQNNFQDHNGATMHPYRRLRVAMASGGTASGTTGGGGNGTPGNSACAACRVLRRKCTAQCLFAPYFPPDQPQRFAHVHKVFGVANVTKMLHNLPPPHREDCVNSLAYEADARVQDPVYGCVGAISVLQQQVAHLQTQLSIATTEISRLRETFALAAATSAANSASQVTVISNIMANSIATANGSSSSACGGSNNALLAIPSGAQGNGNGNCPPNGTQGPLLVQNAVKILT